MQWELEEDWEADLSAFPPHTLPLNKALEMGYPGKGDDRLPVREFPTGIILRWRELRDKGGKHSLSRIQRVSIAHGLSIAYHDERIKEVVKLYRQRAKEAKNDHDESTIKILEEKGAPFSFIKSSTYPTSIGITEEIEGPLSSLAAALGIPVSKMAVYLSLLSLMTLEDESWEKIFRKEVDHFWNCVEARRNFLARTR